ncbi:MAG: hypothetical protein K2Q32_07445 [Alphaproteobacteria bacterium]|nr:hypothetical protein [Alphaproteobacteria bacterium]
MPKNFTRDEDGTVFIKADTSLKKKLGMGRSLKGLLKDDVIEKAETAMAATTPEIMNEIKGSLKALQRVVSELKAGEVCSQQLVIIIEKAFEIKAKAGFCNYPMASSFARFLYLYCEALVNEPITAPDINLISTNLIILTVIFERNFMGEGDNESLEDMFDESDVSPFAGL